MESTEIRRLILRLRSDKDSLKLEKKEIKFPLKKFPVSNKPLRSQQSIDWFEEADNPTIGRHSNIKLAKYLYYNSEGAEIDKKKYDELFVDAGKETKKIEGEIIHLEGRISKLQKGLIKAENEESLEVKSSDDTEVGDQELSSEINFNHQSETTSENIGDTVPGNDKITWNEEMVKKYAAKLLNMPEIRFNNLIQSKKKGYKQIITDAFSQLYSHVKDNGAYVIKMDFSKIVFPIILNCYNIDDKTWKVEDFSNRLCYIKNKRQRKLINEIIKD